MELESAVQAAKEKLRKDPEKVKEEQEVVDRFQRLFRYDNIDNTTAAQFQSFLDGKENRHWPLSRLKTGLTSSNVVAELTQQISTKPMEIRRLGTVKTSQKENATPRFIRVS